MLYLYQALNREGKTVTDYVDAPSEAAARQKIRSQGLYLVKLKKEEISQADTGERKNPVRDAINRFSNTMSLRFSSRQVGLFSRQLATLLKAGLPLPVAISDIIDQVENRHFKNVIADIKEKIEEGSTFSNALQRHRIIFSDMYVNMVRVGESLGSLDEVIERLAEMEEKKNILTSKVRAALWYPSFMFLFAVAVVIFLLVNVIPRIAEMFRDQNRELPLPTKIVIGTSNFLSTFWFLLPVLVLIGIYAYNRYAATEAGRKKIDELKLKLPIFQKLYTKLIVQKFTQNLGILLSNKVDIMKSFEIVEKIVGNKIIEEKITEAAKMIKEGSSVSLALNKTGFLPKLVLGMISAGEASDRLDTMLLNIGNVYETELDLTISGLTSLIEPIIIIIMGIIIATIVMAVMLPIMEMNLMV
ncbi:MAG TPA: type II secretion system F family protein [Spirochaetota bacterium]|nr:type II secretion system F family protein [Spirochaetota bacterium]HPI89178.1 type II secretion system F family protein [Spirochaetota bacterium]HPR46827.1 type II secretion system F family protein [Spirochaetota bacterium]